jgi:DNA-binding NtrC family response regulator
MTAELNGHELAERALKLRPGLKVLFFSDHTDDVVKESIGAAGPFLQKPFSATGLAAASLRCRSFCRFPGRSCHRMRT